MQNNRIPIGSVVETPKLRKGKLLTLSLGWKALREYREKTQISIRIATTANYRFYLRPIRMIASQVLNQLGLKM